MTGKKQRTNKEAVTEAPSQPRQPRERVEVSGPNKATMLDNMSAIAKSTWTNFERQFSQTATALSIPESDLWGWKAYMLTALLNDIYAIYRQSKRRY